MKKLSVAVVVDGTPRPTATYKPRSAGEMKQIDGAGEIGHRLRRDARRPGAGHQHALRGDRHRPDGDAGAAPLLGLDGSDWFKIIEVAILSITALLIGFFVARPLIARMFAPVSYGPRRRSPAGSPIAGQLARARRPRPPAATQPPAAAARARARRARA